MAHPLFLKKSNCKNCYKCVRHCPVQSIRFSGNLAHVIADECVLCGQCYVVCPQDAQKILSEIEKVEMLLEGVRPSSHITMERESRRCLKQPKSWAS